MTNDEVRYMIDQHLGKPKRYTEERNGLEESCTGEWVKHADYKNEIAKLHETINKLKCSASQEYNKGYNAGQYAGPDYNMRNN
jgi:hypothetical protein